MMLLLFCNLFIEQPSYIGRLATANRLHVSICVTKILAWAEAWSTCENLPLIQLNHLTKFGWYFSYHVCFRDKGNFTRYLKIFQSLVPLMAMLRGFPLRFC